MTYPVPRVVLLSLLPSSLVEDLTLAYLASSSGFAFLVRLSENRDLRAADVDEEQALRLMVDELRVPGTLMEVDVEVIFCALLLKLAHPEGLGTVFRLLLPLFVERAQSPILRSAMRELAKYRPFPPPVLDPRTGYASCRNWSSPENFFPHKK